MTVAAFFELFLEELRQHPALHSYYKFLSDPRKLAFRKAYFCQRLQFIADHIGPKEQLIWDCGSGYGTTALFLALNGYRVLGSTLEFYYRELPQRRAFWSQYGDVSGFDCVYEDLYSTPYSGRFDSIIVQDTLHHLEPLQQGLALLHRALRPGGRLLVVEENGQNLVQNLKLLRQRGFNRTVEVYDESLGKNIVFGDEQIRGFRSWKRQLEAAGFRVEEGSLQYIRLLPPRLIRAGNYEEALDRERRLAGRGVRNLFYFGINFTASR